MLEILTVEGYKYSGVKFGAVEPLKIEPREKGRLDSIELREHALEGGEVHLYLSEENRTWADPGYWYAVMCEHDNSSSEDVVGKIRIRRMTEDDHCDEEMDTQLDELDRSHLIDRLTSEVLHFHAKKCGRGPHPDYPARKNKP